MSATGYNRVHIDCHTELGDLFVMEGAIRYFGDLYRNVTFTTDHVDTARMMFAGVPHIIPIKHKANYQTRVRTTGDALNPDRTVRVGSLSDGCLEKGPRDPATGLLRFDPKGWDREFYRHAGLDFKLRWTRTELPPLQTIPDLPFEQHAEVLYHDRPEFPIPANRRPAGAELIRPIEGFPSAYSWVGPIIMAEEIHCIDSAFLNFVETLYAQGYLKRVRLVYHRYARQTAPPTLLAPWEVID
jgi:hypothetical protein